MSSTRTLTGGRDREATVITAVLAMPCGLACAGSVVPGLDRIVTTGLGVLAALTLIAVAARLAVRWRRERQEDRADALTAARWRAAHAPHLLTGADRSRLGTPIRPAVVGHNVGAVA